MDKLPLRLGQLNSAGRWFLTAFLVTVTAGYLTGVYFVSATTHATPEGTVQEFRGNEDVPLDEADEIKFAKTDLEMLNIIHTHVTSFALIFFAVGGIFLLSSYGPVLKAILAVEPFAATLVLFAGISAMRYLPEEWAYAIGIVVMIAGMSTFLSVMAMAVLSIWEIWRFRSD